MSGIEDMTDDKTQRSPKDEGQVQAKKSKKHARTVEAGSKRERSASWKVLESAETSASLSKSAKEGGKDRKRPRKDRGSSISSSARSSEKATKKKSKAVTFDTSETIHQISPAVIPEDGNKKKMSSPNSTESASTQMGTEKCNQNAPKSNDTTVATKVSSSVISNSGPNGSSASTFAKEATSEGNANKSSKNSSTPNSKIDKQSDTITSKQSVSVTSCSLATAESTKTPKNLVLDSLQKDILIEEICSKKAPINLHICDKTLIKAWRRMNTEHKPIKKLPMNTREEIVADLLRKYWIQLCKDLLSKSGNDVKEHMKASVKQSEALNHDGRRRKAKGTDEYRVVTSDVKIEDMDSINASNRMEEARMKKWEEYCNETGDKWDHWSKKLRKWQVEREIIDKSGPTTYKECVERMEELDGALKHARGTRTQTFLDGQARTTANIGAIAGETAKHAFATTIIASATLQIAHHLFGITEREVMGGAAMLDRRFFKSSQSPTGRHSKHSYKDDRENYNDDGEESEDFNYSDSSEEGQDVQRAIGSSLNHEESDDQDEDENANSIISDNSDDSEASSSTNDSEASKRSVDSSECCQVPVDDVARYQNSLGEHWGPSYNTTDAEMEMRMQDLVTLNPDMEPEKVVKYRAKWEDMRKTAILAYNLLMGTFQVWIFECGGMGDCGPFTWLRGLRLWMQQTGLNISTPVQREVRSLNKHTGRHEKKTIVTGMPLTVKNVRDIVHGFNLVAAITTGADLPSQSAWWRNDDFDIIAKQLKVNYILINDKYLHIQVCKRVVNDPNFPEHFIVIFGGNNSSHWRLGIEFPTEDLRDMMRKYAKQEKATFQDVGKTNFDIWNESRFPAKQRVKDALKQMRNRANLMTAFYQRRRQELGLGDIDQ